MTGATSTRSRPERPVGPVLLVLLLAPVAVLLLLGLVVGLLLGAPILGLLVGLVVAAALVLAVRSAGPDVALRLVGGQPADPMGEARVLNLLDGLCAAAGVAVPDVRVLDDPALNCCTVAGGPSASLVVTRGLLERLPLVELEGVLAHELGHLRRGEAAAATRAVPLLRLPIRLLPPASAARLRLASFGAREAAADDAAVALTRYPPGLAAALERLRSDPREVRTDPAVAHLWLDPPAGAFPPVPGESLDHRIAVLREL